MQLPGRSAARGGQPERGRVLTEVERDPVEPGAHPHHLARGAECVQLLRPVAGNAARKNLGLPEGDRKRQSLQRHERLAERRAAVDSVPARQKAAERRLLGRLDLAAECSQRGAPEPPQHLRVAPLALATTRTQLAPDELVGTLQLPQDRLDVATEALVGLGGGERAAGTREAAE